MRSFGRGAGNEAKILGRQAQTSDQLKRVVPVACRTCHERDLGVVSANKRDGDISRLEIIDLGCILVLTGDVSLIDRFTQATTVQLLLGQFGKAPPKVVSSWRIAIFRSGQ